MGYSLTTLASRADSFTPKNRVWGLLPVFVRLNTVPGPQPLQPRRKIRPAPMKTASGIPYWPSRDPIGERGGMNLYGFVGNDGVDGIDLFGLDDSSCSMGDFAHFFWIGIRDYTWTQMSADLARASEQLDEETRPLVEAFAPMGTPEIAVSEALQGFSFLALSAGRIITTVETAEVASETSCCAITVEAKVTRVIHKNSLEYVGDTHVYRIVGPDGATYKIGESAQGVRVSDEASIRAEQQARKLLRETGNRFETSIRKIFPDKASAREYETRLIERFRRLFGQDALPGNKTNR